MDETNINRIMGGIIMVIELLTAMISRIYYQSFLTRADKNQRDSRH